MAFYDDLEASIYRATTKALALTGYPDVRVIYAKSNTLEPSETYCVINIIDVVQNGFTNESTRLVFDKLYTTTHYSANIQYSIIGESARSVAPELRHTIVNNRACYFAFNEQSLGILRKSQLRNVPQLRDTQWVDCLNFDVELSFAVSSVQDMNRVDYIEFDREWMPSNPPTTT